MKTSLVGPYLILSMGVAVPIGAETHRSEISAPAFSVTIRATDANTKKPLKAIRVVPSPYNARSRHVTWQSNHLREFTSLPATFEMERGWQESLLRIEATGYRPVVTEPMARGTKLELDVALEPDTGISGRVLTPTGEAAQGATIALCTWTNEVTVRNGTLQYGHHAQRLRKLVQTSADGTFRLPAECDEWVLVVAHESGYAEPTSLEFPTQSTVQLKPWGKLEGEFVVNGEPVAGQPMNIGAGRGDVDVVLHYSVDATETDAAGKFLADRLPPVKLYATPMFKHGDSSFSLFWFSGLVEIQPGEVTRLVLPRPGQAVSGQFVLPKDSQLKFESVDMDVVAFLRPPRISGMRDFVVKNHAAYAEFMQSNWGAAFRRESISVDREGRFHIEGLPETYYVLRGTAYAISSSPDERGKPIASYTSRVQVPAKTNPGETLDLGVLTLSLHPPAKR